ncbi:uncharacterized protein [Scyliorhinus torazame]
MAASLGRATLNLPQRANASISLEDMARNEPGSLVQRFLCCGGCQEIWRKRVVSVPFHIQRCLRRFTGGSQDEHGTPCQEDTASFHLSPEPTATVHEVEGGSEDQAADGKRCRRRSLSAVSTAWRLKQKSKLTPLSSLPLQKYVNKSYIPNNSDEASEMYPGTSQEDLLTPPVINLIPPTPSNVIDDDQFFEIHLEEGSSPDNECTGSPGNPKTRDDRNCRADQDTKRRMCSMFGNNASHVKGDTSVMPFDTSVESDIYLLKDIADLNSDDAPVQHELKSNWKPEGGADSEAEPNTLSQVNPLQNCEGAQFPQDPEKNDLSNKDVNSKEPMKAKFRMSPLQSKLESMLQFKRLVTRTCSLDDMKAMTGDLRRLGLAPDMLIEEDDSPRQRRITVASYVPLLADQNGNINEMVDTEELRDKSLEEMNTDEVCEWFRSLGLEDSISSIKEAKLQGHQLVSIDPDTLDRLQLRTAEEKEILLSSIYKELHPLDTASRTLDKLLETIGPHDIERFTAALATLSDSQSSDWGSHQSNHPHNRKDKTLENKRLKKSHMVNLSVKAFQQNLQLKVPRDSTVAKVIDACRKILGLMEDTSHLSLNIVTSRMETEELQAEKQISELKLLEKKELKLKLCKKASANRNRWEKGAQSDLKNDSFQTAEIPESGLAPVTLHAHPQIGLQDYQTEMRAKENEIRELKQLIKSLKANHQQILELQKRFHSLHQEAVDLLIASACPPNLQEDLCNTEVKLAKKETLLQHLALASKQLDDESCIDKGVLKQMKLDYQTLKERILTFYQKQQEAQWRNLQEPQRNKANSNWQSMTLAQLIAPHSTAILVAVQEVPRVDGYGFTVRWRAGHGLKIVTAENSHLQPNDRLVEVNGMCVLNASEDKLMSLLTTPSAQILALRNPVPSAREP